MRIFNKRGFFPLFLFFCTTSCSNPLISPWAYAPKTHHSVWDPSALQIERTNRIQSNFSLEIPSEDAHLSLGDLFDFGLRNSPSTKESWLLAREAASDYAVSLSSFFPSANFAGQMQLIRQAGVSQVAFLLPTTTVGTNQISLEQTITVGPQVILNCILWDFGLRSANAEYYYQTLQQMNWQHNENIQAVMKNISTTYYNHLYAKALFESMTADLINAEEMYKASQDKLLFGIASETDMLQTKTNYLQKKLNVTGQEATVKNTFIDLLSTLGVPSNVTFNLGTFPKNPPIEPFQFSIDELINMAKERRPEYLASKSIVIAKEAQVKKAKAELLPQLSISGQGGALWFLPHLKDNGDYLFTITFQTPIFAGFQYYNQIKKSEADLKWAISNLQSKELSVIQDVKTSYNTFISAKQQLIDARSYLEAAEIEFKAMLEKYKQGIVTILDLLSSQAFLSDARSQFVSTEQSYFMSIIDVAFSIGLLTTTLPCNLEE